jgi:hypothetical protein
MKVANRFSVIAGVLAAVICSSALEGTAQPQPIFGCVKPGTGLLRIPPPNEGCKAGETPLGFNDLPLLVGLRNQVQQLQTEVDTLQANGVGAGIVAARIVGLPSQNGIPEDRFGAISGTSDQSLDTGSVAMLSPPVPVVARDLSVNFTSAPLGGNRRVTLLVDGVASQLTCQASGSQSACSDTQHQVMIPGASSLALQVHSENLAIFTVPATDAQVTWRAVMP